MLDILYGQDQKLDALAAFYPHQKTIKATQEDYHTDLQKSYEYGLMTSAALCVTLFYSARSGYVFRNSLIQLYLNNTEATLRPIVSSDTMYMPSAPPVFY